MNDVFDYLFESKLEELERKFILNSKEMLFELECKRLNALDNYNLLNKQYVDYKKRVGEQK